MAEIPEHLLRRSRERRAAAGGGGDAGAAAAPAAGAGGEAAAPPAKATSAAATSAAPAAPALPTVAPQPTAPPPLPKGRARLPVWVMPVIAVLPVFGFFYAQAYQAPKVEAPKDPLVLGEEIYRKSGCSGCHGATGEGNTGPKLAGGEAELTFPDIADQESWVRTGSAPFEGQPYGNPNRPGGQRRARGGMPPFGGSLSDQEIEAVVRYEREKL